MKTIRALIDYNDLVVLFHFFSRSSSRNLAKKKENRSARRAESTGEKKNRATREQLAAPSIRKAFEGGDYWPGAWRRNVKETSRFRRFARSLPTATRKEGNPPRESRCSRFYGRRRGPRWPQLRPPSREFQYREGAFNDEIRFPHSASFAMVIYARGSPLEKTPTLTLFPVYHYYRERNDRERCALRRLDSSADSRRQGGGREARNYFDVQRWSSFVRCSAKPLLRFHGGDRG